MHLLRTVSSAHFAMFVTDKHSKADSKLKHSKFKKLTKTELVRNGLSHFQRSMRWCLTPKVKFKHGLLGKNGVAGG